MHRRPDAGDEGRREPTCHGAGVIAADIDALLARTAAVWRELKDARLFITGGTGFFGAWMLEAIVSANRRFSLGCRATVLTRDPAGFAAKAPHLADDPSIGFLEGDIRDFRFPDGTFSHIIHAATESASSLNASDPQAMFDVCVEGTRRVLALARERAASRFLLTSSGAVYGRQPPEVSHVSEESSTGPDPLEVRNAYAEGKRAAEMLCGIAAAAGMHVSIARCFAFVGPHLPLDRHFAIGNFLRDAIGGGPIRIGGDGTPFRSYLYAGDLTEWLVTILVRGTRGRAYNVGSEEAVSIRDLAERVASVAAAVWPDRGRPEVSVATQPEPGRPASRYVPCCERARAELGLEAATSLDEAIRRTMVWGVERARRPPA